MKLQLKIHIGTEKTGSSFLQSVAARNREFLKKEGIWFPDAGKREKDLIGGNTSPGNAQPFSDALSFHDYKKAEKWLKKRAEETHKNGCKVLLLSNELLVLTLAKKGVWRLFLEITNSLGFGSISYFLVLRDPVDLALSLYKHRAKNGNAAAIEDWIASSFHYTEGLKGFFKEVEELRPNLHCRRYSNREGYLEQIFFEDWLGIQTSLSIPTRLVNPSLSLSELLFLKNLRKYHPLLVNPLYERFSLINKSEKAQEPKLEEYYRFVIGKEFIKHKPVWEYSQKYLSEGEKFNSIELGKEVGIESRIITFSEVQVKTISSFIKEAGGLSLKLKVFFLRIKIFLAGWRKRLIQR